MQNNAKEKGTRRSNSLPNPPALLWRDLPPWKGLSRAGEIGSASVDVPAPLPRPGSTEPAVWEGQGGIIPEEEAAEELWLCPARSGALNQPAGSPGAGWLPAPAATVASGSAGSIPEPALIQILPEKSKFRVLPHSVPLLPPP